MKEKKLTDEEIVKALEICTSTSTCDGCPIRKQKYCQYPAELYKAILNLIHRLQAENIGLMERGETLINSLHETIDKQKAELEELKQTKFGNWKVKFFKAQEEIERLTSLYDGKSGFMTSSIGDLPLTVEGLRKAVDEISRLLVVQAELQELNAEYYNEAKDLRRENAELQKQVDELKERNYWLESEHEYQCEKSYFEGVEKGREKAVKDTAKEIIDDVKDCMRCFEDDDDGYLLKKCEFEFFMREIAKRKGVEVE